MTNTIQISGAVFRVPADVVYMSLLLTLRMLVPGKRRRDWFLLMEHRQ